jgi:hypothetical protein
MKMSARCAITVFSNKKAAQTSGGFRLLRCFYYLILLSSLKSLIAPRGISCLPLSHLHHVETDTST